MKLPGKHLLAPAVAVALVLGVVAASSGQSASPSNAAAAHRPVPSDFAAFGRSGDHATTGEYARMRSLAMQPKGAFDNAAPTASQLGGVDSSRVLAEDAAVGRITAAAADDGSGFCFTHALPAALHGADTAGCNGELDASGLLVSYGHTAGADSWAVFGIAADDVARVDVTTRSGASSPAVLRANGFVWSSADAGDPPVEVISLRGDTSTRVPLPALADHDE